MYGTFNVVVSVDDESQAFDIACEEVKKEIDCAKIGSIEEV